MRSLILAAFAAVTVSISSAANAAVITVTATGHIFGAIQQTNNQVVGNLTEYIGNSFSTTYIIDTEGGQLVLPPNIGRSSTNVSAVVLSATTKIGESLLVSFAPEFGQAMNIDFNGSKALVYSAQSPSPFAGPFIWTQLNIASTDASAIPPVWEQQLDDLPSNMNSTSFMFSTGVNDVNGLQVSTSGNFYFGAIETFKIEMADPVPEPSTWAMMILGFVGVGFMTRRKFKRALTTI